MVKSELNVHNMTRTSAAGNVCTVGFIGVDMHRKGEGGADANDNIAENGLASIGVNSNADNILIFETCFRRILGSHVNMAFCNDKAFRKLNASFGTFDFNRRSACKIAALANEALCTQSNAVGF